MGISKTCFFVGLPGSGKSYWAKALAALLNRPCIDLDEAIEQATGQSISTLFATRGEPFFRTIESTLLKTTPTVSAIVATGGGAACFFDNMAWMNQHGVTIWFKEDRAVLVDRLKSEIDKRPLLMNQTADDLEKYLQQMEQTRECWYAQSQHIVPSGDINLTYLLNLLQL